MASNTSIEVTPSTVQQESYADYSALLLLPVAAVVAHQYSKKQMRKLGRKMMWQLLKTKVKSMLSFKGKNENVAATKNISDSNFDWFGIWNNIQLYCWVICFCTFPSCSCSYSFCKSRSWLIRVITKNELAK